MNTVIGWPRSGTHWMKEMLAQLTGEEWGHSHHVPTQEEERCVLMIRDPRDSFYSHWLLYQHDHPDAPVGQQEFVDLFLKGQMESHQGWNVGWAPHTQALLDWQDARPTKARCIRYELLFYHSVWSLSHVLAWMGRERADVPLGRIAEVVRQTKGARCDPSDLPVGSEMGTPGKGDALQPDVLAALLAYCGPLMRQLGYLEGAQ